MKPIVICLAALLAGAVLGYFLAAQVAPQSGQSGRSGRFTIGWYGNDLVRMNTATGQTWYYRGGWVEMTEPK